MQTRGIPETVRPVYCKAAFPVNNVGAGQRLDSELSRNLAAVEASDEFAPPVRGCKAIIAP